MIAYDHPGSGETVVPPGSLTFERHVDALFGVLDAFDVDRCILAGESMGGTTAVACAPTMPGRCPTSSTSAFRSQTATTSNAER